VEDALTRYAAEAGSLLETLAGRMLSSLAALASALPRVLLGGATAVLATCFLSASLPELRALLRKSAHGGALRRLGGGVTRSVGHWLRAELALCAVTFGEVLAGLLFLREPYALLLALLITLVDALPVFGTGTVLVPWAAAELLLQNAPKAALLGALYLVTLAVRGALEPRLLGAKAGLPPVVSLLAMYLGFCAFGVTGMVLCPFLLICARLGRGESA
ncbi:MAG: AI-2E family transporter, partial [Oscillospiraceae bacterium]|nr:AI-2E family transporter [Oscillospiraceae bacterium]